MDIDFFWRNNTPVRLTNAAWGEQKLEGNCQLQFYGREGQTQTEEEHINYLDKQKWSRLSGGHVIAQ